MKRSALLFASCFLFGIAHAEEIELGCLNYIEMNGVKDCFAPDAGNISTARAAIPIDPEPQIEERITITDSEPPAGEIRPELPQLTPEELEKYGADR